jgi:hypothetical protein
MTGVGGVKVAAGDGTTVGGTSIESLRLDKPALGVEA